MVPGSAPGWLPALTFLSDWLWLGSIIQINPLPSKLILVMVVNPATESKLGLVDTEPAYPHIVLSKFIHVVVYTITSFSWLDLIPLRGRMYFLYSFVCWWAFESFLHLWWCWGQNPRPYSSQWIVLWWNYTLTPWLLRFCCSEYKASMNIHMHVFIWAFGPSSLGYIPEVELMHPIVILWHFEEWSDCFLKQLLCLRFYLQCIRAPGSPQSPPFVAVCFFFFFVIIAILCRVIAYSGLQSTLMTDLAQGCRKGGTLN